MLIYLICWAGKKVLRNMEKRKYSALVLINLSIDASLSNGRYVYNDGTKQFGLSTWNFLNVT